MYAILCKILSDDERPFLNLACWLGTFVVVIWSISTFTFWGAVAMAAFIAVLCIGRIALVFFGGWLKP
jgi:hypothetical protein